MFDYGDSVEYNGHRAKIKSIWMNKDGKREATIVFDDTKLCPPSMDVLESTLKEPTGSGNYYGNSYGGYSSKGPIETHCPKCNSKWVKTKSPVIGQFWFDCPKCKKRKEDI